jgi:ferredoxin-NADP reductase
VPDLRSRDVYVCGPPGMAGPLLAELRGLGVRPAQIHIESFEL